MKRKRVVPVERRRSMPEIDLAGEGKPRSVARSRRGCVRLFGQLLAVVALLAAVHLGLH